MSSEVWAVVERTSNRAIAIVDSPLMNWWQQNFSQYAVFQVKTLGTAVLNTEKGEITCISITPEGVMENQPYYIIMNKPDDISLGEAYNLIKEST